ncbi:MAG: hypothetical protein PF486_06155 [Prolixibacteraceae bacterium]|jgi:hypothetical protein|nr:hypothetical protein [Prolixibacteraceae bacterium]
MSWKDNIKTLFYIRTGDGKMYATQGAVDYKMHYKTATKELEFNADGFDFVGIEGTYVARENAKGMQYPIEIYFEGENHIEKSKEFEESSKYKNNWTIGHPIFGEITCQPLSLSFDSTNVNITKIIIKVWETIEIKYPDVKDNYTNQIEVRAAKLSSSYFLISLDDLDASVQKDAFSLTDLINNEFTRLPATQEQIVELKNKIREVDIFIEEILSYPERFIASLYSLFQFAVEVEDNIVLKFKRLVSIFNGFKKMGNDNLFEPVSSMIMTVASELAVSSTYDTRTDVNDVATIINEIHNNIQTYYENNEVIPNYELLIDIDFMRSVAIGNLYDIAMNSQQERSMILPEDSNPILLTHRFYRFSDYNLQKFIRDNNIGLKETFSIKKGRLIVWYV